MEQETTFNEIALLRILYRRKGKLILFTLLVGIITAIITLFYSNIYSSTAALIIKQPEVIVTGEIPPLNVETLKMLVESTKVKRDLYEKLNTEKILPGKLPFSDFQKMLSTSVQRERNRDKTLLPMVQLIARSPRPALSSAIANQWAQIVLTKTKSIYLSGVDDLDQFTSRLFEQADKNLLENEQLYNRTLLQAHLDVNKSQLTQSRKSYSQLYGQFLQLTAEASVATSLLKQLEISLAEEEIHGVWLGEIYTRQLRENIESRPAKSSTINLSIFNLLKNIIKNENSLALFEQESNLQYKEMHLANKSRQLEQIARSLVRAQDTLAKSEPQYRELDEISRKLSPTITLNKAITDDALWTAYLGGDLPKSSKILPLKQEIYNPLYENTRADVISLAGDIKGLKSRITYYQEKESTLKDDVSQLAREISSLLGKRESLETAIEKDKTLFKFISEQFNQKRQQARTLKSQLLEINSKLAATKADLDSLDSSISGLQQQILTSEARTTAIQRDVDNMKKVRSSIAAKAREIDLLKVSLQDISRSGTTLLYEARDNPDKIGPRRSKTVLISMLIAFFISSGLVIISTFVREN